MTSLTGKNHFKFNFLYYIGLFLALFSSFEYGYFLYEYSVFILGFSAFAKSITLITILIGVIVISFVLVNFLKTNKLKFKLLVYSYVLLLFFIVLSNFIFQNFIFTDISYFLQKFFSHIILFLYGAILGLVLILSFNFSLNNDEDKLSKTFNYFFINFLTIALTSIFNAFYFIKNNHNIQNGFLFTSILMILSIITLISYFKLVEKNNPNKFNSFSNNYTKITSLISSISFFLITCFASIYFYSSSRLLELAYGSSLQIKTIIFSSFFLSLAFGSLIYNNLKKYFNTSINLIGILFLISCVFGLITLILYNQNFEMALFLDEALVRSKSGYNYYLISSFFIIFLNYIFTFAVIGSIYPLLTSISENKASNIHSISSALIFSLFGLIVGVIFTYSFGFEYFGSKFLIIFAVVINIIAALLLFLCEEKFLSKTIASLIISVFALLAYCIVYSEGYSFVTNPILFKNEKEEGVFNDFIYDGNNSTISVPAQKKIYNGYSQIEGSIQKIINKSKIVKNGTPIVGTEIYNESLYKDDVVSVIFSALALSLSQSAKNILSIGFESGLNQSLLLSDKKLEKLDILEIEDGVVKAGLLFGDNIKPVFNDSRSNIISNDIINYLRSNNTKYNIIASNYEIPYFSEDNFTYTKEFYQLLKKHLQKDGILIQKLNISKIDFKILGSILKSLRHEFNYYSAFFADNNRLIIVASNNKISELKDESFDKLNFKQFLHLANVNSISDLNIRYIGNQDILNLLFTNDNNQINSYFNKYATNQFGNNIFSAKGIKEITYINENNLIPLLNNNKDLNNLVTESLYFNKTKFYKEAEELYDVILGNSTNFKNKDYLLLISQNNYCLNANNQWFEAFIKVSKYMMLYLKKDKANEIYSKIVTSFCFNNISTFEQYYVNFVKAIINESYYDALKNAERVLQENQKTKILTNKQTAQVFKYIMLALIKIGRPDLAKTVFDVNSNQLKIENGTEEYAEVLFLYFYALDKVNKK